MDQTLRRGVMDTTKDDRLNELIASLLNKRDVLNGKVRIKSSDLPDVRSVLLYLQDWKCPICGKDLHTVLPASRTVDHCHENGHVRAVLCRNCNGLEGKVKHYALRGKFNLTYIQWLENVLAYWKKHLKDNTGLIHHKFKTPDEKRAIANKRARNKRASVKKRGSFVKQ
jgi:hypothetical protein